MKILKLKNRICFWCIGCNDIMQVCPIRWNWNGDVDCPTLSPSILQTCGPYGELASPEKVGKTDICHCWIKNGTIEFYADSTHDKRGIFNLPDIEDFIEIQQGSNGEIWYIRK